MKTYAVFLLDEDEHWITEEVHETLKKAKERARYLLSDDYARSAETTHERMRTEKAEIWCLKHHIDREPGALSIFGEGECVWDQFRKAQPL